MSQEPKNPIPQFSSQQNMARPTPNQPDKSPQKGKHTIWWVLGSCCAILLIALLVLTVLGFTYRGPIADYIKKLSGNVVNSVNNQSTQTTTIQNLPANNNTVANNTVTNNTTSGNNGGNGNANNTTNTPSNSTGSSGEKNVLAQAVTAKGIDAKTGKAKDVTNVFSSKDEIYYAVLEVSNLQSQDVSVDWYQNGEKVQTYVLKNTSGNKFVNFYLDVSGSDADARVGDYQAKVYFGTTLKKTLDFSVSK